MKSTSNKSLSILISTVLLLLLNSSIAQVIIIKETVPEDFKESDNDFGPNRKRFSHPYASYGTFSNLMNPKDHIAQKTKFLQSIELVSGTRGYLNFGKMYGLTFDSNFSFRMFGLKLLNSTTLPLSNENLTKGKYWLGSFGLHIGNQINLKRNRGNQLGRYINIGGYGNINFIRRFTGWYDKNTIIPYDYKINLKKFKEINLLDFGLALKYGKSNFTIFAKYRLTNLFKNKDFILTELPRVTLGIEFFMGYL